MPYNYPFLIELLIVLGALALFLIGMFITEKILIKLASKKWMPSEITKHVRIYFTCYIIEFGSVWSVIFALTIAKDLFTAIMLGVVAAGIMLYFRKRNLRIEFFKSLAKRNPYLAAKCLQ